MRFLDKLLGRGWTEEGAQFIAERHDDPRLSRLLRKLDEPAPRPRRIKPTYRKDVISTTLRWEVWERDNFTCQHCGTRRRLSIDHIIPESKGGPTTIDNLQTLCNTCNNKKGARL